MAKKLYKLAYNGAFPSTHYAITENILDAITQTVQRFDDGEEKSFNEIKITLICNENDIVNYDKNT